MPLAHVNGFAGLRNTALMPRSSAATFLQLFPLFVFYEL